MHVQFALLCEGTSDSPLVAVLRALLIEAGATSAVGEPIPLAGTVQSKFERLLESDPDLDVIFVHRDSDAREHEPRYTEIAEGADAGGWDGIFVCVVPVRMTEAWLLTDESEIRSIAGKRSGRAPLDLPTLNEIEKTADAKGRLKAAYLAASETTGRRHRTAASAFGQRRAALLERLDIHGAVANLDSFRRLREDIEAAVAKLREREQ